MKKTGYFDKNGTPIKYGDVVEFYYDEFLGGDCGTRMVDLAWFDNEDEQWYLMTYCMGQCLGSIVYRHASYSTVIGSVFNDKGLSILIEDGWSVRAIIELFPELPEIIEIPKDIK